LRRRGHDAGQGGDEDETEFHDGDEGYVKIGILMCFLLRLLSFSFVSDILQGDLAVLYTPC
jgi:hypothetical protein